MIVPASLRQDESALNFSATIVLRPRSLAMRAREDWESGVHRRAFPAADRGRGLQRRRSETSARTSTALFLESLRPRVFTLRRRFFADETDRGGGRNQKVAASSLHDDRAGLDRSA